MCCLYGFLHYGGNEIKNLREITNELSKETTQRGTEATGIAYNDNGRLIINKETKIRSSYGNQISSGGPIHVYADIQLKKSY